MLKNRDVKNIPASAAVYRVDQTSNTFVYNSDDPALEYSGSGLLKKTFQNIHKGDAEEADTARFLSAYETDLEIFRSSLRTVGVGTNIILREGEGASGQLLIPMVGRTESGPDGTVALGKQSRAAGGADGDIPASSFRELGEEFICSVDPSDGSVIVYNLVYDDPALDQEKAAEILRQKNSQALAILQEYGLNYNGVRFETLNGRMLSVTGLTETITQVIDGNATSVENRVLTDNPSAGDFAGVDTIIVADLPPNISFSQISIHDGETNFDGELLKRSWSIETPEAWKAKIEGSMPISPAPKKVFDNWEKVESALTLNL